MSNSDSPLALIGHPTGASRALRELGIVAVSVPTDDLRAVVDACQALKFRGALIHSSLERQVLEFVTPDSAARRTGRVDAVAFAAGAHGTFALSDALSDTLEDSGYATRGASAVIIGLEAHDLALALPLARLGFSAVGIAADTAPEAERAARDLPAGLRTYPMSRRDPALPNLTERADLIILTGGQLPQGILQPYHTLIDLTGLASAASSGATPLDLFDLPTRRLARQLAHATGQRLHGEVLGTVLHALG